MHATLTVRLRAAGCVFAEDEAGLLLEATTEAGHLDAQLLEVMVRRREQGHPLEHIVGWAAFDGWRVRVGEGVFVPRRRSEFVVEVAVDELIALGRRRPVVVDLCCGSGAIAGAIARRIERIEIHAVDVDPVAVACARGNLAELAGLVEDGSTADVVTGDLYRPLALGLRGRVDLIVCSPPYVPTGAVATMPIEARVFEPLRALDGGDDGLAIARRVISGAGEWLAPDGVLLVEGARSQAPVAAQAAAGAGLTAEVRPDAERGATVLVGRRVAQRAEQTPQ